MKFLTGLFAALGILFGVCACDKTDALSADKIYFFTKDGCSHCEHAKQYIQETYPTVSVDYQNVANQQSVDLLLVCVDKFNLDKNKLGTPLICMGDKYFLGWSEENKAGFDKAVQNFMK